MLSEIYIKYSWFILFCLFHIFFLKKEYIPVSIANLSILLLLAKGVKPEFCLKLSVILNIFANIIHNRRFKVFNYVYISIVSIGFLILSINDIDSEYILNNIQLLIPNRNLSLLLSEIIILSSILMLVGFANFSDRVTHLFISTNQLFKIIFITPMYISLFILQKLSTVFLSQSFIIVGFSMSLYSVICLIFCKNLKIIFFHIIVYFYGLQILFFSQTKAFQILPLWLIIVMTMIFLYELYTPNRGLLYRLSKIREYIAINKWHVSAFVLTNIVFILNFVTNFLVLRNKFVYINVIFILPFWFYGRVIYYLIINKASLKQKKNIEKNRFSIIKMTCMLIYIIFFIFSIVHFFIKNYLFFNVFSFLETLFYFFGFTFALIAPFLLPKFNNQPSFLLPRTYSNLFVKIFDSACIIFSTSRMVVANFIKTFNLRTVTLMLSKTTDSVSSILYENYIYFYILFLVEILIVLTIECIVL